MEDPGEGNLEMRMEGRLKIVKKTGQITSTLNSNRQRESSTNWNEEGFLMKEPREKEKMQTREERKSEGQQHKMLLLHRVLDESVIPNE